MNSRHRSLSALRPTDASPRGRRWLALLMVLMLLSQLLWQTMGQMHGVVHAPGIRALAATPEAHSVHGNLQADAGWVSDMFNSHGDDGTCRLIDQLGCGDALLASPFTLPAVPPVAFALAVASGEALARWAALFDARGPPVLR